VIAVNPFGGVTIQGYSSTNPNATHGIAVRGNSIYANTLAAASRGLGITLIGQFNVTLPDDPQDVDGGPNGLQNYPVLTSVSSQGSSDAERSAARMTTRREPRSPTAGLRGTTTTAKAS